MLFNSVTFLIFFPIVTLIYFMIPKKVRYIWLLIISYYFYMCWNANYALLMAGSTVITYLSGILMERFDKQNIKKAILATSLILNLGILSLFKYLDFFLTNLNLVLEKMNLPLLPGAKWDLLLPVGISFYTFQALSYSIDVYRKDIYAEKNLLRYSLFVSFFPQLVAGPIERSKNLLKQINQIETLILWNYERVKNGLLLMLWGYFQKLMIADRAAIYVNLVYDNISSYGALEYILASILFAFQIYCDFAGYTNIARGAAQVLGFTLTNNFAQPYLAVNINDFWKRWHISLTSWFRDYLYFPLGGNRKGLFRKYLNTLIVFLVSGLWHGSAWNFIAWGGIHGIMQIGSDLKNRLTMKYFPALSQKDNFSKRLRKRIGTFVLVCFAWMFFRANSLHELLAMFRQMKSIPYTYTMSENTLINDWFWIILIISIIILIFVDLLHEQNIQIRTLIAKQEIWFRTLIYILSVWVILMLGIYGIEYDASQFIYFQF